MGHAAYSKIITFNAKGDTSNNRDQWLSWRKSMELLVGLVYRDAAKGALVKARQTKAPISVIDEPDYLGDAHGLTTCYGACHRTCSSSCASSE